jgi:hypothetical protein
MPNQSSRLGFVTIAVEPLQGSRAHSTLLTCQGRTLGDEVDVPQVGYEGTLVGISTMALAHANGGRSLLCPWLRRPFQHRHGTSERFFHVSQLASHSQQV